PARAGAHLPRPRGGPLRPRRDGAAGQPRTVGRNTWDVRTTLSTTEPVAPRARFSKLLRPLALAAATVVGMAMLGGSTVSYYEEALPTTMNPLFARSMVDRRSHELVFDRLFYRSAITNELKSRLVSRFEVQEGGKKLKMWLVEGVKWHDGKPFGPDDVCFTVDAMLDPGTPSTVARDFKEAIVGCT